MKFGATVFSSVNGAGIQAPEFIVDVNNVIRCEVLVQSRRRSRLSQIVLVFAAFPLHGMGQPQHASASANSIKIDAREPSQNPRPTLYRGGTLFSPSGRTIGINSMYLTMDGHPWLPVMGEFHYSRVPESEWDEELLKMKTAGVQIVSTYVIWIHHEEIKGTFDWSGQKDLRHFAELCGKHGLYLVARIGPWTHGEVRNGGLPDWQLKAGPTRLNDVSFMTPVGAFYDQIGSQLRGLLWKDGGPVIGIQLENEYSARGRQEGEEYILALKKMAIRSGLDVPLYTVTGWDNAVVPRGEVLPVFGGYPDAPWDGSIAALPANEVYAFRFQSRVAGSPRASDGKHESAADRPDTPFLTAELGGGVQDTYHRRPVIEPHDVAAMVPVMLGSGANLYGYYMFQGGENPNGKLTTLEESQATGYPTDVPTKSYDFQAPLSEFGQEHESFRKLKVFHYFLNDFGSDLARMSVHQPLRMPRSPQDLAPIRASVRSDGKEGFLFVNNYVRGAEMPLRKRAQFHVLLPGSELQIPEKPVDIPSGAYFIWPFNLELGNVTLKYATAQLFTRINSEDRSTFFFEQVPGIPAELVVKSVPGLEVHAKGAVIRRRGGDLVITKMPSGFDHGVWIRSGNGPEVRLILLTTQEAENSWKTSIDGTAHLVETDRDFITDEKSIVLQSFGDARVAFTVFPKLNGDLILPSGNVVLLSQAESSHFSASVPEMHPAFQVKKVKEADHVPPVRLGPSLSWRPHAVAMAPEDAYFGSAAKWLISIRPNVQSSTVRNLFLKFDYTGDLARLSADGNLLVDNLFNGLPWMVGLRRFSPNMGSYQVELSVLPLRKDAPIFLESRFRPGFGDKDQLADLNSASAIVQYEFKIGMAGK